MRHRKKGKTLSRKAGPRKALLRNLAAQVILHERVKTTKAKAKAVQPVVERAITTGKQPSLHARRKLMKVFYTPNPINKIFEELGPRYQERPGGYTRVVKLGPRKNDGAEMAMIELV